MAKFPWKKKSGASPAAPPAHDPDPREQLARRLAKTKKSKKAEFDDSGGSDPAKRPPQGGESSAMPATAAIARSTNLNETSAAAQAAYRRAQSAPPMHPANPHPLFCDLLLPPRAPAPPPPDYGASSATGRPTDADRAAERQKNKKARRRARRLQTRIEKAALKKVLKQAQRETEKRREEKVRQRQEDEHRLLEMQQLNAIQVKALLDEQMHKVEERYQTQQRKKEKREERDKKREERDRLEREQREEQNRLEREERDRLKLQEVQRSLQRTEAARRVEEKRRRELEQQVARLQAEREAEEDAVKIEAARTQFELRQQENDLRVRQDAQKRAREVIRDDAVVRNAAEAARVLEAAAKTEQEKQIKRARKEVRRAARAAVLVQAAEKEAIIVRDSSPAPEEPRDEIRKQEGDNTPNQHVNVWEDSYLGKNQLHNATPRLHIRFDADGGAAPVPPAARMPTAAVKTSGTALAHKRRLSQDKSETPKKPRQNPNSPPTARPEHRPQIREYRVSGPPPRSITPAEVARQARMRINFSTPYRPRPSGPTFVPQGSHVRFLDESWNRPSLASDGGSTRRLPRNATPHPSSEPAITYVAPPTRGRIHRAPRPPIFEFNLEAAREAARANSRPPLRSSQLREVPTEFYTSPAPGSWLPRLAGIARPNTPMISSPLASRGRTLNLMQRLQLQPTAREAPLPRQPSKSPRDDPPSSSDSDHAEDDSVSDREQSLEIPDSQDYIEASMSPPPPIDDSGSDSSDAPDDDDDDDWEFGTDDVSDEDAERAISRSSSRSSTVPLCIQARPRRPIAAQTFRSSPPPEMTTHFEDDADSEDAMEISEDDVELAPVTLAAARAVLVVVPPRTSQLDRSQYVRFTPPELIAFRQSQWESESLPPTTRPRRTARPHLVASPHPSPRPQRALRTDNTAPLQPSRSQRAFRARQYVESSGESSGGSSEETSGEIAPVINSHEHQPSQSPQRMVRTQRTTRARQAPVANLSQHGEFADGPSDDESFIYVSSENEVAPARDLPQHQHSQSPRPQRAPARRRRLTLGDVIRELTPAEIIARELRRRRVKTPRPEDWTQRETGMTDSEEEEGTVDEVFTEYEESDSSDSGSESLPPIDRLEPDMEKAREEARRRKVAQEASVRTPDEDAEERDVSLDYGELNPDQQDSEAGREGGMERELTASERQRSENKVLSEDEIMREEEAPVAKPDPEDHEREEYEREEYERWRRARSHYPTYHSIPFRPDHRADADVVSEEEDESVQSAEKLSSAKREPDDDHERELFEQWRRERSEIPYHLTPFKDPRTQSKNMEPEMVEDEDASPPAALGNSDIASRNETADPRISDHLSWASHEDRPTAKERTDALFTEPAAAPLPRTPSSGQQPFPGSGTSMDVDEVYHTANDTDNVAMEDAEGEESEGEEIPPPKVTFKFDLSKFKSFYERPARRSLLEQCRSKSRTPGCSRQVPMDTPGSQSFGFVAGFTPLNARTAAKPFTPLNAIPLAKATPPATTTPPAPATSPCVGPGHSSRGPTARRSRSRYETVSPYFATPQEKAAQAKARAKEEEKAKAKVKAAEEKRSAREKAAEEKAQAKAAAAAERVKAREEKKAMKGKTPKKAPAGVSTRPWPPLEATTFGLVQEQLKDDPFKLIVATIFLNKTRASVAMPVMWNFLEAYPTPESIIAGEPAEMSKLIGSLGLQFSRVQRFKNLAADWLAQPPAKGFRSLRKGIKYPLANTTPFYALQMKYPAGIPENTGYEIGHLRGIGPYTIDSWRIFCRDKLANPPVEEWRTVVPMDKELRSYIRWRWLKEGVTWVEKGDEWRKEAEEPEPEPPVREDTVVKDEDGNVVQEEMYDTHDPKSKNWGKFGTGQYPHIIHLDVSESPEPRGLD